MNNTPILTFQRMPAMFQVSKHIDFCYGHRLLNYAGKCNAAIWAPSTSASVIMMTFS